MDLLGAAEACAASQRDLARFSDELPADPGPAIAEACRTRRAVAFTHLVLAALHRGCVLDAALLVDGAALVGDPEILAALAGHLTGDVAHALVAAVRGRGLGPDREPAALLIAACWARRADVPVPPELVALARVRARRQLDPHGEDALVALHGLIDDPDLGSLIADLVTPDVKEAARILASRLVQGMVSDVLSVLPERPERRLSSQGPVRRAVSKVGRNEPCPCGSGKKYKVCHEAEDQARLAESSDVEGLTVAELDGQLEAHLTEDRLLGLRGYELAHLEPARVQVALRPLLADQLAAWGEIDAAIAVLSLGWTEDHDEVFRVVAEQAAKLGRADAVAKLAGLRPAGGTDLVLEARMALAESAQERLDVIEADACAEADSQGVDLALGLLAAGFPGLGLHVARAQLVIRPRDAHSDALQYALLEARDALLLPPWDPIDEVLYTIDRGVDPRVDRELEAARSKVDQSESALAATHEALERLHAELAQRQADAPAAPEVVPEAHAEEAPAAPHDDAVVRDLKERLGRLKGDLKERHRERNALRRDLEQTRERMAELQSSADEEEADLAEDDPAEEEVEVDVVAAARVRVPRFPDDFSEILAKVPEATARAAMSRVGELCAGYEHAFRECRPLRGFEGTWRVKVGRSYRLLFQPGEQALEVIDLVHRQQLEKRLSRLRRGGE